MEIEDVPLIGAADLVQLLPCDGHRDGQPWACSCGKSGNRAGASLVAQVVDEDLADPILRPHLCDDLLR